MKWNYTLMHKNIPVVDLKINLEGKITYLGEVYTPTHLPVGIKFAKGRVQRSSLNNWWLNRAIPASRSGIAHALESLNLPSTGALTEKSLGLSLSDQYWIRPIESSIRWEEVNFFDNSFSEDVGNILWMHKPSNGKFDLMSPDNTSDGWLRKKWIIIDGMRCLVKDSSGAARQEAYNEVLASRIMEHLGIPHVSYELLHQDGYAYCVCKDFITRDTELIPAWYVMQTQKKENHVSIYNHYLNCCEQLDIPNVRQAIDQMIVLDFLIVNEDRHQTNFGVVRDANTLEFLGPAPIFDSGTSLWFDKPTQMIGSMANVVCKPFKTSHEQQLGLVSSFDWVDFSKLDRIEDEWMEITEHSVSLDEVRRIAIAQALRQRILRLESLVKSSTSMKLSVDSNQDVLSDVKYSGS